MHTVNTETYVNPLYPTSPVTINVWQDPDPESPREWCNLGTIVASHRHYNLQDKGVNYDLRDYDSFEECVKAIEADLGEILWLPVRMYEHSGIALKAGHPSGYPWTCQWDSGWVGLIYIEKSKVRSEYSRKRISGSLRKRILDYLANEIDTYSQYLNGEVYGFTVEGPDGEDIESCGGFFGSDEEYMLSEAKADADRWLSANCTPTLPGLVLA